jgi:hypothetical protein
MKRLFLSGLVVAALMAPHARATPAWTPPACSNGQNLSVYLATVDAHDDTYSCEIGDKIFSNFTFTSSAQGGATAVTAAGVTVGIITGPDIGLSFNASWTASANQTIDSVIGFRVTVISGGPLLIEDFGLAQTSGVTGNGSASVTEDGCGPAPCTPGPLEVMTFDLGGSNTQRVNETIFSPIGSVQVSKDINVIGGTVPPSLSIISLVSDTFSQTSVPEPLTFATLGGGLIALGLLRRKSAR